MAILSKKVCFLEMTFEGANLLISDTENKSKLFDGTTLICGP